MLNMYKPEVDFAWTAIMQDKLLGCVTTLHIMDEDNLKPSPRQSESKTLTSHQSPAGGVVSRADSRQVTRHDSLLVSKSGQTSDEESEKESGAESDSGSAAFLDASFITNDSKLKEKFKCPMCGFLDVTSPNFLTAHNMVMCYLADVTDMRYSCFAFKHQVDEQEHGARLDTSCFEDEQLWYIPKVVTFQLEPKISEASQVAID